MLDNISWKYPIALVYSLYSYFKKFLLKLLDKFITLLFLVIIIILIIKKKALNYSFE